MPDAGIVHRGFHFLRQRGSGVFKGPAVAPLILSAPALTISPARPIFKAEGKDASDADVLKASTVSVSAPVFAAEAPDFNDPGLGFIDWDGDIFAGKDSGFFRVNSDKTLTPSPLYRFTPSAQTTELTCSITRLVIEQVFQKTRISGRNPRFLPFFSGSCLK
ncbi:MAG: hypothetical protein LBD71_05025, partial [Treponema sp.]|nr:hypothetical protein [Treponema sp.]